MSESLNVQGSGDGNLASSFAALVLRGNSSPTQILDAMLVATGQVSIDAYPIDDVPERVGRRNEKVRALIALVQVMLGPIRNNVVDAYRLGYDTAEAQYRQGDGEPTLEEMIAFGAGAGKALGLVDGMELGKNDTVAGNDLLYEPVFHQVPVEDDPVLRSNLDNGGFNRYGRSDGQIL